MQLTDALPAEADVRRRFRHGALGALVLLLGEGACASLALGLGALAVQRWPWWALALAALPALLGLLLGLVVVEATLATFLAAFRPTNWLAALGSDALWLHLRSYLNAHFADAEETVLGLAYSEIECARRVRETLASEDLHGQAERMQISWLELSLRGVDAARIAAALRREQERKAPVRSFLGLRSSSRFEHRPVRVVGPDRLHVEWKRGMLAALEQRGVPVERRVRQGPELVPSEPGYARALAERGLGLQAALHLARVEGLPLAEAKRRVTELERV